MKFIKFKCTMTAYTELTGREGGAEDRGGQRRAVDGGTYADHCIQGLAALDYIGQLTEGDTESARISMFFLQFRGEQDPFFFFFLRLTNALNDSVRRQKINTTIVFHLQYNQ